jgi:serine/threonine protein phosphatase PrpC
MGNRLSPATEKSVDGGSTSDGLFKYAVCGMQGRRSSMEDAHLIVTDLFADDAELAGHSLFAVFDGHGGSSAAKFAARNFQRVLLQQEDLVATYKSLCVKTTTTRVQPACETPPEADRKLAVQTRNTLTELLEATFLAVDRQMLIAQLERQKEVGEANQMNKKNKKKQIFKDPGTTALVVVLTPKLVVCANAGDCRAVLIQKDETTTSKESAMTANTPVFLALSEDHRPDDKHEERRIKKAGGYVFGGRLEDDLAVSRGFGDYRFKEEEATIHGYSQHSKLTPQEQKVSPLPEIKIKTRKAKDRYLFLGCDGVFEQMKTEKVVRVLTKSLEQTGGNLQESCSQVSYLLLERRPRLMPPALLITDHCFFAYQLLDSSLRKGSKDNMTAVLVSIEL